MDFALLDKKLQSQIISPSLLFSNLKFLNEETKVSPSFIDSSNLPFYYHLGKQSSAENVLQVGVAGVSGYIGPCFLQGCKTVKSWFFWDDNYVPLVEANLKKNMTGEVIPLIGNSWQPKFKNKLWDLAIVSVSCVADKFNGYLSYVWEHLKEEGLLVVDYISEKKVVTTPDLNHVFLKFCRVKQREPVLFETRNGVGILIR